LLLKAYPQFHPKSAFDDRAVVLAKRKAPVSPIFRVGSLNSVTTMKIYRLLAR
jgi:hypothetical protein